MFSKALREKYLNDLTHDKSSEKQLLFNNNENSSNNLNIHKLLLK